MDPVATGHFDPWAYALPLAATAFFVVLNGFFVAAEFALVKARVTRLDALAEKGSASAAAARLVLRDMGRYLSACQLGITLASLILGWLAEPAVAELLLAALHAVGAEVAADSRIMHGAALVVALTVITGVHMIFGEQAPKIWAIQRAESTAMLVARPLRLFTVALRPLIWAIDSASNLLLRVAGLGPVGFHESGHDVGELRSIVATAARAGHISSRQSQLAQNVFGIVELEARHILVPRVDVVLLLAGVPLADNLGVVRETNHSRYPLCETDLDSVIGIVHTRDLVQALLDSSAAPPDLRSLARPISFIPETQPLSRVIASMQLSRSHVALVLDEHGSAAGLAFLEDALEEIVGPLSDEFDEENVAVARSPDGSLRLAGGTPLPKAAALLGLTETELDCDAETVAGLVVARLGRLPVRGDLVEVGPWRARVERVARRRIVWLRFEPVPIEGSDTP